MPAERIPELETLVGLFYDDQARLARFEEVSADDLPADARQLLAHDAHMTVTVESYHQCPVRVDVLQTRADGDSYWREILLRRECDGRIVQYGIVRLDFKYVSREVRQEIESKGTPLGRVLIEHDVLRKVELHSLWRLAPGPRLTELFQTPPGTPVYGRTALIYCNGEPAVELLEIVSPLAP
jgi:chorismate-pyruvate lyase